MMYRDWREVTKKLLSSKGPLSTSILPKGKMKRKETKVYVKWVVGEIIRNRKAFDGFTKGHGIIATRERFLKWYKEQQEGALGGGGGEELAKLEAESEEMEKGKGFGTEGEGEVEVGGKVIIMPIAIPGCGEYFSCDCLWVYVNA
jgi:tRNA ligase